MPQFSFILLENQAQDAPKTPQDAPRGPKRRPQSPPRHPQDAPRRGQDASQDAPRPAQDAPKRPQEAPRHGQDARIGSKSRQEGGVPHGPVGILVDFWWIFDRFLVFVHRILAEFLIDLWSMLDGFSIAFWCFFIDV